MHVQITTVSLTLLICTDAQRPHRFPGRIVEASRAGKAFVDEMQADAASPSVAAQAQQDTLASMTKTHSILQAALDLTADERAEVALRLMESLDEEPEADVEAAWAVEVRSRVDALRQGDLSTRPAVEVFREARRTRPQPDRRALDAAYKAASDEPWHHEVTDGWQVTETEDWPA
jgi:putative addiction module component (TIGR02574 family)